MRISTRSFDTRYEQIGDVIQHKSNQTIEHYETHISHVFLTDKFAYKFKKPLKFDFLDFSTLEDRRFACAEEVRLNRRLAPDVYLDVVGVCRDEHGNLELQGSDGSAEPVEWAVKMVRLPDDVRMDELIANGQLTETHVESVSGLLIDFYKKLTPEAVPVRQYSEVFHRHILDNRTALLRSCELRDDESMKRSVQRIHCRQMEFLTFEQPIFESRTADNGSPSRIVEGHGDLRPDHIYLSPHPLAIDCIEFNREFRTVDIADELAFLAMQCEYLNAEEIGHTIMKSVLTATADRPPEQLVAFYKTYRACVRAKVAALRGQQCEGKMQTLAHSECDVYLKLADQYAGQLGNPKVTMVRGLMGTGKTTFAKFVAKQTGCQHLQTDSIRQDIFGERDQEADYGEGLYSEDNRMRVYDEIMERTRKYLANGISVVLDGAFLKQSLRTRFENLAEQQSANFIIATCCCPEEENVQRIVVRSEKGDTLSDARPELLAQQRATDEPIPPETNHLNLDATKLPHEMFCDFVAKLRTSICSV